MAQIIITTVKLMKRGLKCLCLVFTPPLPPLHPGRIMVMDAGRVIEFAGPNELLSNKKSSFYSMAKDAGLVA